MSVRRFVAYFLAVSAGSTVAFAPALRGQPAPPVMDESETIPTPTDAGQDALLPETARPYQAMRNRPRHRPDPRAVRAAPVR